MDVNSVIPLDGPPGGVPVLTCGEEAFRYLLETERARAERAGRPVLLLLVSGRGARRPNGRIAPAVGAKLFEALSACVREVDFIGWFREGQVAGVVLTQGPDPLAPDAPSRLGERLTSALREHLSPAVADRFRVRVLQLQLATTQRAI